MKNDLEGKKLLILGANPETIPLVKVADTMGVLTLVTSNRPDDAAKKYAWKACDVDGLDVPGLITLAREEKADGVLVGVADILVPVYCKVCDALGLPCYATQSIVDIFSYKDRFKSVCERYGIHGIPEYYLDSEMRREDLDRIKYPVMIKPVDSYSGLGMTVAYSEEELRPAIEKALSASHAKRFIVERYMLCDDVGIYYTFKDGYCSVSCIYDRYTTNENYGLSRVNLGSIYPSKHTDRYFQRMHRNAVRMFRDIGIRNGVLLISAFYEDGEFYVYDPGFRLQGEAPHLIMKAVHGFDQRAMLVRFALTGSEGDIDLAAQDDVMLRGKYAATHWFLLKPGIIGRIEGLGEAERDPNIAANVQRLYEGDEIPAEWAGTERQVLTRLYHVCGSKRELTESIRKYNECIKVYDISGNNMLLKPLDTGRI